MSMKFLKKRLEPAPFNVYAFLAAILQNLDTQIEYEHKASDSDEMIKETRPAIALKREENGSFSCVVPLELINYFVQNPFRIEVKTGQIGGIEMPVAVMAFTPIASKEPQLFSPNGHVVSSESETLKKALEKS